MLLLYLSFCFFPREFYISSISHVPVFTAIQWPSVTLKVRLWFSWQLWMEITLHLLLSYRKHTQSCSCCRQALQTCCPYKGCPSIRLQSFVCQVTQPSKTWGLETRGMFNMKFLVVSLLRDTQNFTNIVFQSLQPNP